MYFKLVKNYWKGHVSRFVCLLLIFLVGISVVTCTGLLLRSEKDGRFNELANYHGLYDFRVFNMPISLEDDFIKLSDEGVIGETGSYYELGYAHNELTGEDIKIASFSSEEAINLYHMDCYRGDYPKNSNEIAIDVRTANKLGLIGNVGEIVTLQVKRIDGTVIGEKTYTVSGVFSDAYDMAEGGYHRYPRWDFNKGEYDMPQIIVSNSVVDEFNPEAEVFFFKTLTGNLWENYSTITSFVKEYTDGECTIVVNGNASGVYSLTLNIDERRFNEEYDGEDFSFDILNEAIKSGMATKDVYSAVLVPCLIVFLCIVMVMSLTLVIKNVIADRREMYGILRSIGLSSKEVCIGIGAEITCIALICLVLGNVIGYLLNIGIVDFGNKYYDLNLNYGFDVISYAKVVTFNPIMLSVVLCVISLVLSLVSPIKNIIGLTPTNILSDENSLYKNATNNTKKKPIKKASWLKVINNRISIHTSVTLVTMVVVLGCMLFGYSVFTINSEKAAWEELCYVEDLDLVTNNYVADIVSSNSPFNLEYKIYNHHDYGLSSEAVDNIMLSPYIENGHAIIKNESTRLCYLEEPGEDVLSATGYRTIGKNYDPRFVDIGETGYKLLMEYWGYDPNILLYQVPTVGLMEEDLSGMNSQVVAGSIDIEKIATGEEVVLAVPEYLKDSCLSAFPIGSELPLSDIVFGEDEYLNLNSEEACNPMNSIYTVEYEDVDGSKYPVYTFAFGDRAVDINTRVGAIVVIDEAEYKYYLTPDVDGVIFDCDEETWEDIEVTRYGMSILTLDNRTFASWGLPDHLYTDIKIKTKDDANLKEFNNLWISNVYRCKGMTVNSVYEYERLAQIASAKLMFVYYTISVLLVMFGIVATIVSLYSSIRDKDKQIKILRMIGLSSSQCTKVLVSQNVFYPFISIVIALIPIYAAEALLRFIRMKVYSGEWEATGDVYSMPWYEKLPFGYSMVSHHFFWAVLICLIVGIVMVAIGTLPQIGYIRKTKMISEEE